MASAKRKKSKKKSAPKAKTAGRINIAAVAGPFMLVTAIAVHLYLIIHFNFTQDDAFITFRYAANFLDGHGLVYNIGERVEGLTNFFWAILMILGTRAGIETILFSKILGALCGSTSIFILYLLAKDVFATIPERGGRYFPGLCCLLLGAVYSYAYWTVAGLETAAFSLMVITSVYLYLRKSPLVAASLVLATLLRPEGGLVAVIIVLYEIFSNRKISPYAIAIGLVYIIFLLPLAAFKILYYGAILPNPFYAKTSFDFQQIINGLDYTGRFFWHYLGAGLFVLPALIVIKKVPKAMRLIMTLTMVYVLYITLVGGDVLKVHRFFVPIFPFLILIVVVGLRLLIKNKYLVAVCLLSLLAWQMIVPRDYVIDFHCLENGLTYKMNRLMTNLKAVDNSNFTIAVSTIGVVGYRLMGHTVIDLLGLTDSTIARHPEPAIEGLESTWRESHFNNGYVLSRSPDYILFSTGFKPSAPAERAMFLYSAFLNNYRTIGFSFEGLLHGIYKRFYPLPGNIERDVDVNFVQHYNKAINLIWDDRQYDKGMTQLDTAFIYAPEPKYPYLYYYWTYCHRLKGDYDAFYHRLLDLIQEDTLLYQAYKDLYTYECLLGNEKAAEYYLGEVERLTPWYVPQLKKRVRDALNTEFDN
ncbi:MAG: hypothetical protein GY841_09270 [FCB group bacterium]|nr:hypothetical protein [FCB group bacterium]